MRSTKNSIFKKFACLKNLLNSLHFLCQPTRKLKVVQIYKTEVIITIQYTRHIKKEQFTKIKLREACVYTEVAKNR